MAKGPMTEEAAKYLVGTEGGTRGLRHYPPPKPTYRRTFRLRSGWIIVGERTKARIENRVPYAQYVQSDEKQAYMHQGYWRTVSQVIHDNEKGMLHAAELALQKYLKQKGLI